MTAESPSHEALVDAAKKLLSVVESADREHTAMADRYVKATQDAAELDRQLMIAIEDRTHAEAIAESLVSAAEEAARWMAANGASRAAGRPLYALWLAIEDARTLLPIENSRTLFP